MCFSCTTEWSKSRHPEHSHLSSNSSDHQCCYVRSLSSRQLIMVFLDHLRFVRSHRWLDIPWLLSTKLAQMSEYLSLWCNKAHLESRIKESPDRSCTGFWLWQWWWAPLSRLDSEKLQVRLQWLICSSFRQLLGQEWKRKNPNRLGSAGKLEVVNKHRWLNLWFGSSTPRCSHKLVSL